MKKRLLKHTAVLVMVSFIWFSVISQGEIVFAQETHPDQLTQGKERYDMGDYEKSIQLLNQYLTSPGISRENQAEAYYFLAKNYYAVSPDKTKEMLFKSFESDYFFTFEEKDSYFKKTVAESRTEYLEPLKSDEYLSKAEIQMAKGMYGEAKYFYRVALLKLSSKTIEKYLEKCEQSNLKKQQALEQYRQEQYESAFSSFEELIKTSPNDEEIAGLITSIKQKTINPLIETGDKKEKEKKYAEAIQAYEGVLKYMPNDREVREKLSSCRQLLDKENADKARKIEQEKAKALKKKKFPVLPVVLGAVAITVILVLLLKKKKPKIGSLSIDSTPNEAAIWLMKPGENVYSDTGLKTYTSIGNLAPGQYSVKLVKTEFYPVEKTVNVVANQTTNINETLPAVPSINISPSNTIDVYEGDFATVYINLTQKPSTDVEITVTRVSGDSLITVSPEKLTFNTDNYSTPQPITINAGTDDSSVAEPTAIIQLTPSAASLISGATITVTRKDVTGLGELTVEPLDNFKSSGPAGGPFSLITKTYRLTNTGTKGKISWKVSKRNSSTWIKIDNQESVEGTLSPDPNAFIDVKVSIDTIQANSFASRTEPYEETISFKNLTNGKGDTERKVELTVTSKPILSVTVGDGINGTPTKGFYQYDLNTFASYNYTLKQYYRDLTVKVDGVIRSLPYGTILMDASHNLEVSALEDNVPSVTITEPANKGEAEGIEQSVKVNASDDVGVSRIVLYVDNTEIPECNKVFVPPVQSVLYTTTFNSKLYTDGDHELKAVATDTALRTSSTSNTVRFKNANIFTPQSDFTATGNAGGPFPDTKQYTITNPFPYAIDWKVSTEATWITFSQSSGQLSKAESITITVSIDSTVANGFSAGTYEKRLVFEDLTTQTFNNDYKVKLIVQ